jgi:hypothetical protein
MGPTSAAPRHLPVLDAVAHAGAVPRDADEEVERGLS